MHSLQRYIHAGRDYALTVSHSKSYLESIAADLRALGYTVTISELPTKSSRPYFVLDAERATSTAVQR